MRIDLDHYWRGHDFGPHTHLLTVTMRERAARIVVAANIVIATAESAGIFLEVNQDRGTLVNSGWRPPKVNSSTPNASVTSLHMQCGAIDITDVHGELDEWLFGNGTTHHILADLGLWMEHPSATKNWCHLQDTPQNSFKRTGLRYFYP